MPGDFKPTKKYLLLSRDFYREIKDDLVRIQASLSVDDARSNAEYLVRKLKEKFETPNYDIQKVLTSHESAARNSGVELAELDETGKEKR